MSDLKPGLVRVERDAARRLVDEATAAGWRVFSLRGSTIDSRSVFFREVKASLPLDPPLAGDRSWDALSDSLWGGIDGLNDSRVLIVWEDASVMARAAPDEFEMARSILDDVARSLGSERDTDGSVKEVEVVLAE